MLRDFRLSILVALVTVAALVIGFSFPSIIPRGGGGNGAELQKLVKSEDRYCRANLDDVNCACFSKKSGQVMVNEKPRVQGATYANQLGLARSQASQSCKGG